MRENENRVDLKLSRDVYKRQVHEHSNGPLVAYIGLEMENECAR